MKTIVALLFSLVLMACQSTQVEPDTSILVKLPVNPVIKVQPRLVSGINYQQAVWVDLAFEFDNAQSAKITEVKFVDSSHPNSSQLTENSIKAFTKWKYSPKNIKPYVGQRLLVRVHSTKSNKQPDFRCNAQGCKKVKKP
ncbi:hypothetical protein C2869_06505 [Saccharobesus litoralis]|uniref:Uncharacterized protein n=1 Tax=Saccharobesus litoralis TaxID=2172099 RepID=A0A2S0VPJ9_9ALTE|nr:hypothetical protein [Saccharobesus litoralis]AWB66112.1 hypothetical protein C2869_06505 [Saccharobesus litoralis]